MKNHMMFSKNNVTRLSFLIVLVSFILSTFVSLWSLAIMSQRNTRELSKMMAARIYDTISSELNEPVTVSLTMSKNTFLIDALRKERDAEEENTSAIQEYLATIHDAFTYESVYVISDSSRRYYNFDGVSKIIDPERDEYDYWYKDFMEKHVDYDLDVGVDEQSHDTWTVFVDAAIQDLDGSFLGVCGVGMHMDQTYGLVHSLEKEHGVKILLLDQSGLVQIDTEDQNVLREYEKNLNFSAGGDYIYHDLKGGQIAVSKYLEKLDWFLVVESDGNVARGEYFNVILLNIVLCIFVMVIIILTLRIIAMRTIALTNASFRDQSTQLLNRRAFEEEKAGLSQQDLEENFVYITVDINGLKTANDTIGHAAGDELIHGTADCMRKIFSPYGKIFRIGGDEFSAMLHVSKEQLNVLQQEFEQTVAEWEGERIKTLAVSCGYAASQDLPSANLTELIQISDERMYEAKDEYYKKMGIERRKT